MFSVTPPPLVFVTSRVPHQPAALQRHDLLARSGIAVPRSTHGIICRCHTAVAFSLYSTTLDELLALSAAGEIMPPNPPGLNQSCAMGY